jgi:peptide/nickel transport system ATP-binding protein
MEKQAAIGRQPAIEVEHLQVQFKTESGYVTTVEDVSFSVRAGETLCIVGESGSGKSVTSLAIMGLLDAGGRVSGGQVRILGEDVVRYSRRQWDRVRGKDIAMIFQEPMSALNPAYTIGNQLIEQIVKHRKWPRSRAEQHAVELLAQVGISRPKEILKEYPHQLSGGMRQRVMIAMALSCEPKILIADEPTTALDVTIQAQILSLLKEMQEKYGLAIILITHDMGVVSEMADRVLVMYAGQVVEESDVFTLFEQHRHPYTKGLMECIPHLDLDPSEWLQVIPGTVPSFTDMPEGCRFQSRCPFVRDICRRQDPGLTALDGGHRVRCWMVREPELFRKEGDPT